MFVPFETISPQARIWIYQADRPLDQEALALVERKLQQFTTDWSAHGQALKTSFAIRFNQFIVLAADEDHHSASGCSIDGSVRVLKEIREATGVDLLGRNQVAFRMGDGVLLIPVSQLKQRYQEGVWDGGTITFNNLVASKSDFEDRWMVTAADTWLRRYIATEVVKLK